MKRKIIILGALAVIVIAGLSVWLFSTSSTARKVTYITASVARGDISDAVTATGTVEPVTKVEVGTQVSGIIDKLHADYNSVVTRGEVIAEMDKVTLQSELDSKKAAYDGSKAEFEYQQKNYVRSRMLHEKTLISDQEYEQALYNYEKAKSTFESNKADLAKVQRNLSYATITSPINGVVINRAVEEGQTVAAGFETPTLFTIAADLTRMQVVADVDEADIGGVAEGQRVSFTVDAYPNDVFEGEVTQVRLEATVESNVVTYEVVISAPNPDLKLKPGLTANVSIYVLVRKNVLSVPARALRFTPEKPLLGKNDIVKDCPGTHKVWTYEDNTFTAHLVETGITNGTQTEITGGITEGIRVVTEASIGKSEVQAGQAEGAETERSPFMPGRPGSDKKKK